MNYDTNDRVSSKDLQYTVYHGLTESNICLDVKGKAPLHSRPRYVPSFDRELILVAWLRTVARL